MKQILVTLKTLSPVVLSAMSNATVMTASHTYFSGSILRGIIARRYIAQQELGTSAQEDADFLRLFFGDLRFTAAQPADPAGKRSFAAPFSLQRSKDGKELLDLLHEEGKPGFKSMKGFVSTNGSQLAAVSVDKVINLHMSRNDQKNKDGQERLAGRSLAGGIYNYEAIAAGQTFVGAVYGEEADLQALKQALQASDWQCYAGRSKYTQYGHCALHLGEITDVPAAEAEVQKNSICLRLDSALLQAGGNILSAEQGLSLVAAAMNARTEGGFSIRTQAQQVFAKAENVENFVGIWGMKRPRVQGLAAGTVFLLQKDSAWTEADKKALQELLYTGVGDRTEEGFGQLRIWPNLSWQIPAQSEKSAAKARTSFSVKQKDVQKQAAAILQQHLLEQAQVWAAEDVQAAKKAFSQYTAHFFARLSALLGAKTEQAQNHFRISLQAELANVAEAAPFAKGLQHITVREHKLSWYLLEASVTDMPYNQRDWQKLADSLQLNAVFAAIGFKGGLAKLQSANALFYTYWHWFFRYARKAVAGTSEGDDVA